MTQAGTLSTREAPPQAAPLRVPSNSVEAPAASLPGHEGRSAWQILKRLIRVLSTLVAVTAVAVLVAVAAGPRLGLFRVETVLSGSMQPSIDAGDVIVVTPEPVSAIRVGQVISYQIPIADHHVESHRIVKILSRGPRPVIVTKGDANPAVDPWQARLTSPTAWRTRFVVPGAGRVIIWLRQPLVHLISVLVLPTTLALWWLIRIWRPRSPSGPTT